MNAKQRFLMKSLIRRLELAKGSVEEIQSELKGLQNDEADKFDERAVEKFKEAAAHFEQATGKASEATAAIQEIIDCIEKAAE